MSRPISIEQDLATLAHMAARLLSVPVATITAYGDDPDNQDDVDAIAHTAISCHDGWAERHPDIDLHQLGSPRTAVTQHLGCYASVPLRNVDGSVVGMAACADDQLRELGDGELALLKHVAGLAAAVIRS